MKLRELHKIKDKKRLDEINSARSRIESAINALPIKLDGPKEIDNYTVWVACEGNRDKTFQSLLDDLGTDELVDEVHFVVGDYFVVVQDLVADPPRGWWHSPTTKAGLKGSQFIVGYALASDYNPVQKDPTRHKMRPELRVRGI